MTREQDREAESALSPSSSEDTATSPRQRKKVTFGSTAKIEAPGETDSQRSDTRSTQAEIQPHAGQDVRRFLNIPLEDYDASDNSLPSEDTFVVIRRHGIRSRVHQVFRFNKEPSLWLLGPLQPIRMFTISVVTNEFFESFIIVVILINCAFLALKNPPEDAEYAFTAVYTLEMLLKILSRGFILHTYAYLRDPWNWLDFVVVLLGYITMAPNISSFTAIRTVRVLRALRTISVVTGLRAMVNTLLRSLKLLSDVLVLFLFFLCVMALIGLQLFVGELRRKCVLDIPANLKVNQETWVQNSSHWYIRQGEPVVCGNSSWAGSCPENYTCMPDAGPNPNHGYTSFDHIGWALLMAFQILTMDYWENLYNKIIKALGQWYVIYFVITIFFCSFYLLNLVLAVVYLSYEKEMQSLEQEERRKKLLKKAAACYTADSDTLKSLKPLRKSNKRTAATIEATQTAWVVADIQESYTCTVGGETSDQPSPVERILKCLHAAKTNCENYFDTLPLLNPLRQRMRTATKYAAFDAVIIGVILLNTIVLGLYHHGIKRSFESVLDMCNMVFTIIFVAEMIWKLIAFGPSEYVQSRWNVFDAIIVVASVAGYLTESGGSFSIFRSLRLFRVLNLAQSWRTMAKLVTAITKSVGPVGNITLILGVIIYIFAVVGVKVFGDAYTADKFGDDGVPRWNFNDFWHAFMMVFRVLCGEWMEPLWDCMRATNPLSIVFFLSAFVIGNFIVLNLFIALLLSAFDSDDEEAPGEEEGHNSKIKQVLRKMTKTKKTRLFVATYKERYKLYEVQLLESNLTTPATPLNDNNKSGESDGRTSRNYRTARKDDKETCIEPSPKRTPKRYIVEVDDCMPECCMIPVTSGEHFRWLKCRCSIRCLVEHKYFEWFILLTVIFSSLVLVFEDVHLPERPILQQALQVLNFFFAAVFSLEFVLKIIGLGVIKYFSSVWNCLDAFIVSISLACLSENKQLSVFRSLRTLRSLRPLRAISRLEGMKVVINALFAAIPGIGNVLVVSLLFWLIFSILGVQLFSGKFFKCVDNNGKSLLPTVVPNKTVCLQFPDRYEWKNSAANFDNVVNGFLALFQVATFEGWLEVMHDAVDSTEIDHQPKDDNNMVAYIYFVAFIILGSFFVLNLFVGVVIDNFNTLKKKYEEICSMGMLLTETQRKWVNFLREAAKKKPPAKGLKPKDRFRGFLYDVVTGDKFEIAILMVIMCNMIMMMIQHYGQSPQITSVLRVVLDEMNAKKSVVNPSLLRVMRIFRIARLLRVLEFAKGIRQLLVALMISLPALFNIGTLLFLVIFIYAIIGMSVFGQVKKQGTLDDIVNFETFGSSMMLLFRLSTGSGWNDVMSSLSVQPPNCDPKYKGYPKGNCGTPLGALTYLISYIIIVFMIIVNMYIAVILENVNRAHESDDFAITKEDFDSYYRKWAAFVSSGKQFLPLDQLSDFVDALDKPFKIPKPNTDRLRQLDIPVRAGDLIHCFDVLKALVRRILEEHGESPQVFQEITVKMEAQFTKSLGRKHSIKVLGSTQTKFRCDEQTAQV